MVNKGFKTLVKAPIKTRPFSIMNLNLCLVFLILVTSCCFTSAKHILPSSSTIQCLFGDLQCFSAGTWGMELSYLLLVITIGFQIVLHYLVVQK